MFPRQEQWAVESFLQGVPWWLQWCWAPIAASAGAQVGLGTPWGWGTGNRGEGQALCLCMHCYSSGEDSLQAAFLDTASCAPGVVPHAGDGVPGTGMGEELWWNANSAIRKWALWDAEVLSAGSTSLGTAAPRASIWHPPFRGLGFLLDFWGFVMFWTVGFFFYLFFHWDLWKRKMLFNMK